MALYLFSSLSQGDLEREIVEKSLVVLEHFASEEKVNAGELGEVACAALAVGSLAEGLLQKLIQRFLDHQDDAGWWGNAGDDVADLVLNTTKILAFWYRYTNAKMVG